MTEFWADDFDMDLPKIFPDARKILGDLGDIELYACGKPDKNGKLNHPNVWNGDHSMLSFWGFRPVSAPAGYVGDGCVKCTAWEMFRDCWAHSYLILLERRPIWDTTHNWPLFEKIMWELRGWGPLPNQADDAKKARRKALKSYTEGVRQFGRVVNCYPEVSRAITA